MQLRQIGELRLLEEIRRRFSVPAQKGASGVVVGIGDDAAAAIVPPGEKVLVTTDMMHEGVHFDLSYTAPFHLGFKLVSVNVSDIAAMGGTPRYLFLTVSMKGDTDETFFQEFYQGIELALQRYGLILLGGDLSGARNDMVVSATLLGTAEKIVTRGGASAGDKIYVTYPTGDAGCGLELLRKLTPSSKDMVRKIHEKGVAPLLTFSGSPALQIEWEMAEPLIMRHLMPVARDVRTVLPYITAMIDVSDGLFMDLWRLCDESKVGARIYLEKVPISQNMRVAAESMGLSPLGFATSGGEDYELLFTVPARAVAPDSINALCIGEITDKERIVVDDSGKETALKIEGYQHFGTP
jgi:thiamine-monophosphate kinase